MKKKDSPIGDVIERRIPNYIKMRMNNKIKSDEEMK